MRHRFARKVRWTPVALLVTALVIVAATLIVAPSTNDLSLRVHRFVKQHGGRRVPLAAVSPLLREAVVATEDERFYRHTGIDLIGILRAVPYDLSHFSLAEGASTIPEQLAKILYLRGSDHALWRKAQDIAIASHLSHGYSHEQVLDAYLNVVYLGEHSYGVDRASRHYFSRPAARLSLAQASLLAGLIQAPSRDDPATNARGARQRQVDVLRSMVRNGFTTTAEAESAFSRPLRLATGTTLPPLDGHVPLAPGAPFDWGELAFAIVLLGLALAAFTPAWTRHSLIHARARSSGVRGFQTGRTEPEPPPELEPARAPALATGSAGSAGPRRNHRQQDCGSVKIRGIHLP